MRDENQQDGADRNRLLIEYRVDGADDFNAIGDAPQIGLKISLSGT
jgi:hypothetical protein